MSSPVSPITGVWIAPGCIVCNLCEDTCPQVFDVQSDSCSIRPGARGYFQSSSSQILQAAKECPVDVIRIPGFNEPEAK